MSEGAARSLRVAMIGYLVTAIADGTDPHPSFAEGLSVQRVLAAVQESAANESVWVRVAAPARFGYKAVASGP